jgi:hypothetical protein
MAYRSATTASGNNQAPAGLPPVVVAGDRLYLHLLVNDQAPVITVPPGWSEIASVSQGTPTPQAAKLYEIKSASGAESYTFGLASAKNWMIQAIAFSGRSVSGPAVVSIANSGLANPSPINIDLTSVNVFEGDDVLILAGLAQQDTTPPVVAVTAPNPNQTVTGTFNFTASAFDDTGVVSVQFKIDDIA